MKNLLENGEVLRKTILAIRESFGICNAMGINPKKEKVNKLYYYPLFISSFVTKKVFSNKAMQAMFDAYLENSKKEVIKMVNSIIISSTKCNIATPYLQYLKDKL